MDKKVTEATPIVDHHHLSVPSPEVGDDPKRSRSLSVASSARTVVEEDPSIADEHWQIQRRQTQVAIARLSWWDCLKGIFGGLEKLRHKLAVEVKIAVSESGDGKMFDDQIEDSYIRTISVYPCRGSEVTERQEGRCVLDTACFQGNLISLDFAHRLGFTEFGPLKPRECNGGTVVTGNIHEVLGAVHVSWFHCTSPKIYRDMRFLVSESPQIDMIIGTQSIVKYNLIPPPNLCVGNRAVYRPKKGTDPQRVELMNSVRLWDEETKKAQRALRFHKGSGQNKCLKCETSKCEVSIGYDAKIARAMGRKEAAELTLELHNAKEYRRQLKGKAPEEEFEGRKQIREKARAKLMGKEGIESQVSSKSREFLDSLDLVIKDIERDLKKVKEANEVINVNEKQGSEEAGLSTTPGSTCPSRTASQHSTKPKTR